MCGRHSLPIHDSYPYKPRARAKRSVRHPNPSVGPLGLQNPQPASRDLLRLRLLGYHHYALDEIACVPVNPRVALAVKS